MAAVDETFNPANLTRLDTSSSLITNKNLSALPKTTKANSYTRIDLEPIYTDLKDAIGSKWDIYFDAVSRFVRGALHAREFGDLTDEILYSADNILHLHNRFICAIAFNSARDSPEPGIATWVTAATDKSVTTNTAKTAVTSDAGEQRLKKEVMAIHARDRRRLKNAQNEDSKTKEQDDGTSRRNEYEEAYSASRYKVPDVAPTAAGLTKTNWEPEIKRGYQQPLFAESAEFPDATNVFARMVPKCYEEAIPQGSTMACAEYVVTAAEYFFKEFLGTIVDRVRVNGPSYDYLNSGHDGQFGGGAFTASYRKQVVKEMEAVKNKTLHKTRDDEMLPVEFAESKARKPLTFADLKLANTVGPKMWNRVPLLGFEISNNTKEDDYDAYKQDQDEENRDRLNGNQNHSIRQTDEMDIDDEDYWDDVGYGGRGALDSILDDCLAMSA